ncbi:unnamed protein product [Didymodactylos carnosus]|uniref:B box-type domain-containing protein n=1 Tax=Didymodactylos carnosus TaxID=1234261 RepID=A0A814BV99_9BILA|nr:unnamed protein product [Didymodactylos carnosus]CAF0934523.1 unnamed protein product [Didymodactylos carnosus]CAF3521796.1 unnamed protein product [Didymodactylos carnosus]CAF3711977.1 unnamed protein product [Didymodactylos carnosus]
MLRIVKQCQITSCKRKVETHCYHCNQDVCGKHFNQHKQEIKDQIYPLVDEINELKDKLNHFEFFDSMKQIYDKLEVWKYESHQFIDQLYTQKYHEIEMLVKEFKNEKLNKIDNLGQKIKKAIDEDDETLDEIQLFQTALDTMKNSLQKQFLTIDIKSLNDPVLIQLTETINKSSLLNLNKPVRTCILKCYGHCRLASNEHYLLTDRDGTNLSLYDNELILKHIDLPNSTDYVRDVCWCQLLNVFIILTQKNVYSLDVKTFTIETIDKIIIDENDKRFFRCTCSNETLYILFWADYQIQHYSIESSGTIQRLDNFIDGQYNKNEFIYDICTNTNNKLGLTIFNRLTDEWRLDLCDGLTMTLIWSFDTIGIYSHLSILPDNEWLLVSCDTNLLYQITSEGKLKAKMMYEHPLKSAIMFSSTYLIIRTFEQLELHKIK